MGRNRILAIFLVVLAAFFLVIGGLSAVLLLTGGPKGGSVGGSGGAGSKAALQLAGGDPITLDPHLAGDSGSAEYIVEIFSGLMTIDPKLNVVPDLAESYKVSDDGKSYTFVLRENATFHNGRPVEAKDVKCSIERAASKQLASPTASAYLNDIIGSTEMFRGTATEMKGIEVIGARTVKISIDAPKPYFLAKLSFPTAFVVDCGQVKENPRNWTRQPNGTGPYKLKEWRLGERLVLQAYDGFYAGKPKLAQAVYAFSGGSAFTRFQSKELDVAGVSVNDIDSVRDKNNPLNKLYRVDPSFSISYIAMNVKVPPLDDVNVRRALGLAMDRQKITDITFNRMVAAATGILPPELPGFTPNDKSLKFNPEEAKKALAASSYAGKPLPVIELTEVGAGAEGRTDTQAYIEGWKQVLGLEVRIRQTDQATFYADVDAGKLQMFNSGWIMDYPDPENVLDLKFYSKSRLNDSSYANPKVDQALERARTERDPAARIKLYQQAEVDILNDAVWLPLYFAQSHSVVSAAVKGWFDPPMVVPRLRFVSVER